MPAAPFTTLPDPNAVREFPFDLYDLQAELVKTTDVSAVQLPQGGNLPDGGALVARGVIQFRARAIAEANGFVTAVALYRVAKAATTGDSVEARIAQCLDFVSVRQPYQFANPYIAEALTKRKNLLVDLATPQI